MVTRLQASASVSNSVEMAVISLDRLSTRRWPSTSRASSSQALTSAGGHASGMVVRASGHLAVHGYDSVLQRRRQPLHPRCKAGLQRNWIQQADDTPEGVGRGNAVRQLQEGLQPSLLLVAEELDLGPVVSAADDGQCRNQKDDVQEMAPARIGTPTQASHGCMSTVTNSSRGECSFAPSWKNRFEHTAMARA